MRVKLIGIIFLLAMLNMTVLYAEEAVKNTEKAVGHTGTDKLTEELSSDDASVREKAIDRIFSEAIATVKESVKFSTDKGNVTDSEKKIVDLTMNVLEKYAEKSSDIKGEIKGDLNKLLSDPDTREIIAPFIGVFLQVIKEEVAREKVSVEKSEGAVDKSSDKK
ncbi:MAG: hypothetical protein ABRQ38_12720 [Candidatus Eremiobacterota bacterium]